MFCVSRLHVFQFAVRAEVQMDVLTYLFASVGRYFFAGWVGSVEMSNRDSSTLHPTSNLRVSSPNRCYAPRCGYLSMCTRHSALLTHNGSVSVCVSFVSSVILQTRIPASCARAGGASHHEVCGRSREKHGKTSWVTVRSHL